MHKKYQIELKKRHLDDRICKHEEQVVSKQDPCNLFDWVGVNGIESIVVHQILE